AKRSLFKIPFVGWGMWAVGDIGVTRGSGPSIARAMQSCSAYLQADVPLCIFPEGTRATGETLLPFKDGAFRLAIENGADVLPLAVAGTQRGLPKHSWRFGRSHGIIKVGTPISTRGLQPADVPQLSAQARGQIEDMLRTIIPLTRA
ncbi:MAG: 1-acyl-sn-glycerol-3-phosphate acyltransferase, partial [Deltaproteobacteria bacterium]